MEPPAGEVDLAVGLLVARRSHGDVGRRGAVLARHVPPRVHLSVRRAALPAGKHDARELASRDADLDGGAANSGGAEQPSEIVARDQPAAARSKVVEQRFLLASVAARLLGCTAPIDENGHPRRLLIGRRLLECAGGIGGVALGTVPPPKLVLRCVEAGTIVVRVPRDWTRAVGLAQGGQMRGHNIACSCKRRTSSKGSHTVFSPLLQNFPSSPSYTRPRAGRARKNAGEGERERDDRDVGAVARQLRRFPGLPVSALADAPRPALQQWAADRAQGGWHWLRHVLPNMERRRRLVHDLDRWWR